jgi:hypothetical protein
VSLAIQLSFVHHSTGTSAVRSRIENRFASPAPKANEDLDKAKFYAENGKSEKRPGFGYQGECDCYTLCTLSRPISIAEFNSITAEEVNNFCINIGNAFSLYRMFFRHIAHKRMWWYKCHFKRNWFFPSVLFKVDPIVKTIFLKY